MAYYNENGYYDENGKWHDWEHGGWRPGSGRKENWDAQFTGKKKPHSVYCTDKESDEIKFFIFQRRALKILLEYEPTTGGNTNKYDGDRNSWNKDFEFLQNLNLQDLPDPNYQKSQKEEIKKILKRCLKK